MNPILTKYGLDEPAKKEFKFGQFQKPLETGIETAKKFGLETARIAFAPFLPPIRQKEFIEPAKAYFREAQPAFKWAVMGMPEDIETIKKLETMPWADVIRESYPMLKTPESRLARSTAAQFGVEMAGDLLEIGTRPSTYAIWGTMERLIPVALRATFKKLPKGWQETLIKERFLWGRRPVDLAYRELGLKSDASFSDVRNAYHKNLTKWHPDKAPAGQSIQYARRYLRTQGAFDKIKASREIQRQTAVLTTKPLLAKAGFAYVPNKQDLINAILKVRPALKPETLARMSVPTLTKLAQSLKIAIPEAKPEVPLAKFIPPEKPPTPPFEIKPKALPRKIERLYERIAERKVGRIIQEDTILGLVEKGQQMAAREAFVEGKRTGRFLEKEHFEEMIGRAKEKKDLREETKKLLNQIRKIDTSEMSPQHAMPIRDIQDMIDFTKPTKKTLASLTATRTYLETNPEAEMPDYVYEDLMRLEKLNRDDMTIDELKSLTNAVLHHAHLEKTKWRIKVKREKRRAQEVLNESIIEMKPAPKITSDIVSSQKSKLGRLKRTGQLVKDTFGIRHDHYDLMIESLSGKNSTMDKVLYQGVKEGIIEELGYRQNVYKIFQNDLDLKNFMKKYKIGDIASWMNERVTVGKFDLTKGERMALYRHSLNANNLRHLLDPQIGGFGLKYSPTPNIVHKITREELDAILNNLTSAEKEFSGKPVVNLFDNQHTALNKVFYEKNGYELAKENNYYPIEVMRIALPKELEAESILEELKHKWVRIGIKKGMLEHRIKSRLPIYLNSLAYDVNKSVMNAAAYVGLEMPLSNASKLLYNRTFRAQMYTRYGSQTWNEIEKGLRDIAGDWQSYTTVEELLLKFKNNLTTAVLGISFAIPKQILSYALYNVYVKPQYLIQGFMDHVTHPFELLERHRAYSPELAERVEGGYSRDVADVFKTGAERRVYKGRKSIKERLMGGVRLFDLNAVSPGMQGAVLQVLDEFKTGELSSEVKIALDITEETIPKLSSEDKMKLAYKFADYVTERTQPMFSPEHRSSLSRGATIEKLATQFSSFTNQALNLIRRTWRGAKDVNDPTTYAKLAKVLFLLLVVNTGGVMAINEMRDRLYRRKEKTKRGILQKFGEGILDSVFSYFYFLRDLERSVVSKVKRGTFVGYDISIPVLSFADKIGDAIADGIGAIVETDPMKKRKRAGDFIENAISSITMGTGIPFETPKKMILRGGRLFRGKSILEKYGIEPTTKTKNPILKKYGLE